MGNWLLTDAIVKLFERATGLDKVFIRNPEPDSSLETSRPKALNNPPHNLLPKPTEYSITARELYNVFRPLITLQEATKFSQTPLTTALDELIVFLNDINYPDNEWENTKLSYLKDGLFALHEKSRELPMDGHVTIDTAHLEKLHTGIQAFDRVRQNVKQLNQGNVLLSPLLDISIKLKSMLVSRQISLAFISGDKLPPIPDPVNAEIIDFRQS